VDAETDENQPYCGTEFVAYGHYGSTIHDPIGEPERLVLVANICDTCIMRAIEKDVIQSRGAEGAPRLAHHHLEPKERAWVLAQNEKQYGCAWGDDQPVDYREQMLKAGWPEEMLDR
jgi:hypothetical protein